MIIDLERTGIARAIEMLLEHVEETGKAHPLYRQAQVEKRLEQAMDEAEKKEPPFVKGRTF